MVKVLILIKNLRQAALKPLIINDHLKTSGLKRF